MTFDIAFVLIVVILMIAAIMMEIARADIIVFVALVILLLAGILTTEDALKGFSNEGMLTIALLFIVARAIQKSGAAERLIYRILNGRMSQRLNLLRILAPVSIASAFLNNTPIVVTLTPMLKKWFVDRGLSPSKVLIPLSYSTILGGTITLMGTSTNLVINGMLKDIGMKGFSFFELGIVGGPALIIGLIYLITIGYKVLPNHKVMEETVSKHSREYLSEVVVEDGFPFDGKMIRDAGLRNLQGLFLVEVIRGNEKISPVRSSTIIHSGDRLIFTGLIETIAELQHMRGLRIETGSDFALDDLENGTSQLVEVVVSHQASFLLHSRIKDTQFRSHFDAGVIAVHRNSERIQSKIGDIRLRPGDTLLLLAGPDFYNRIQQSNAFYVTTSLNLPKFEGSKGASWIPVGTMILIIVLVSFHIMTLFKGLLLGVVILLLTKALTPEEAKNSVQFNVLLLIASAFGVGSALLNSGAAAWVANGLVTIGKPMGTMAVLIMIYLLTNLFTEFITNNAAAVIMLPIGIQVAQQLHANPMAFIVAVKIAASASFSTPIGYQTNLIVYGPGGYKFKDYLTVGIPLNILVMVVTITMTKIVWLS